MAHKIPVKHRFWTKVNKSSPNGCWFWTASTNGKGYGTIGVDGKSKYAHRLSYEWAKGPIPDGLQIDHLCRNRNCVNPDHLEAVTNKENAWRSPIHHANRTHCPKGHPYSGDNLLVNPKTGNRMCRICRRAIQRTNYRNRRRYGMPFIP